MIDIGFIIAILCRQSMCFPKIKILWQEFLSHNTELLFVKEVMFVFGCCRNLSGKIPWLHFTFKKYIKLKSGLCFDSASSDLHHKAL